MIILTQPSPTLLLPTLHPISSTIINNYLHPSLVSPVLHHTTTNIITLTHTTFMIIHYHQSLHHYNHHCSHYTHYHPLSVLPAPSYCTITISNKQHLHHRDTPSSFSNFSNNSHNNSGLSLYFWIAWTNTFRQPTMSSTCLNVTKDISNQLVGNVEILKIQRASVMMRSVKCTTSFKSVLILRNPMKPTLTNECIPTRNLFHDCEIT